MKKQHPLITDLFNVLISCGYESTIINSVSHDTHQIEVELMLPYHREIADFESFLPNIKQEFNCTDAKIIKRLGKNITVLFGKRDLNDIQFNETYLHPNTLKIELPSSYGSSTLDFADGASCHLLNGGTTRMGKTKFLLYLSTVLYVQTNGNIELYITSTKAKDFFMFQGLAHISKTASDFEEVLDTLITEYQKRDKLLYSPALEKATDAKDVIEYYPHMAHHFKPIFLLADEYARFSDNKEIQKKVIELAETAGYINIHLIITTQRPDARTVLPPRIKGNLLARICFTTADEANSVIILDRSGAESLGRIAGRAILSDSEYNIVQVPLITTDQVIEQLKPFRGNHHVTINQNPKGTTNTELSSKIQDMFTESTSQIMFSEQLQSDKCLQPNHETVINGWDRLAHPTVKGKDISVHSKSKSDPSQIK